MFANIPDEVLSIIEKIEENGFEAYMVGGCVRDCVMGVTPHDYDICSSALPEETMEIFKGEGMVTAGLKHGTVGIIRDKQVYEITTYRLDGEYSDGRHPDSVAFTRELKEDLLRRDFTINAMAYNPRSGLVDIYGGCEDIKNGIIRCVGNAEERFSEDSLRILRAIRFASRFDFEIEKSTADAMNKLYPLIESVSTERISSEFMQTIMCKGASRYINEFKEIIAFFIPEIKDMFGFEQHSKWHCYDVWNHTMVSLAACDDDIYVKLTMFFHDIGKPHCFTQDENGEGHFYKHAVISEKIAHKALKRMRLSNDIINKVSMLTGAHDIVLNATKKSVKKILGKFGEEDFERLLKIRLADRAACNREIEDNTEELVEDVRKIAAQIKEENECFNIQGLAVKGGDVIKAGIQPGPEVGKMLKKLLDEVIEGNIKNEYEELILYIKDNK